jgi:hypothetical protein
LDAGPPSHLRERDHDLSINDPLPGQIKPGERRLSPQEAETLPKIVSVPISAENARPLLESLDGETAPPAWQGALPITYRLSGSQTKVRMQVEMEAKEPAECDRLAKGQIIRKNSSSSATTEMLGSMAE